MSEEDKEVKPKKKSGNPAFYKGMPSNNPTGLSGDGTKPKHERRKTTSKLRRTESQLLKLNPEALITIQKSVNGEDVDKESLNTCKWVISTTVAVGRAALAEELGIASLKTKEERDEASSSQEAEDDEDTLVVFSTTMLPTQADLKSVK